MATRPSLSIGTFFGTIGFVAIGLFCYLFQNMAIASASSNSELHPYFSYTTTELKSLDSLNSDKVITEDEVNHWVQVAFDLVRNGTKETDATRVYAYLFTAQKDAAALSYQAKNKLMGNLTAVSRKTLCLVVPEQCSNIPEAEESDAYSLNVAEIVTKKVKERIDKEKEMLANAPTIPAPKEWEKDKIYFGNKFGYQLTWLIKEGNQFRLEDPKAYNPVGIKLQKAELKQILLNVTKNQIELAKKWSAGSGTILTSGQWLDMANNYMDSHHVPLEQKLVVLSILAMGIADATIAYFDSKYAYWKLRPQMLFPDLNIVGKSGHSPSYPSGHATISMAAAILMDYYFPENREVWDQTAKEISQSRLWGGVHFPIDEHDGLELGRRIGDWIVSKLKNSE
jgi:hypothetical protein